MTAIAEFLFSYGAYFLTPIHVIVCLLLIAVVLLQTGKGADLAGAFGGAGTQTAFGPRSVENTLSRATKYGAAIFMVTSLGLSIIASRAPRDSGLGDLPSGEQVKQEQERKAEPEKAAPVATPAAEGSEVVSPDSAATPVPAPPVAPLLSPTP